MMKKVLFIFMAFCFTCNLAFAKIIKSHSDGYPLYVSERKFSLDDKLNATISLACLDKGVFNYSLSLKFTPKDKGQLDDLFLQDVYLQNPPIFAYWDPSNPAGHKVSSFDRGHDSLKFEKRAQKYDKDTGIIKPITIWDYRDAELRLEVGRSPDEKPKKMPENWATNTEFGMFMVDKLNAGTPFVINIPYYYNERERNNSINLKRCQLIVNGEAMNEWREIFAKTNNTRNTPVYKKVNKKTAPAAPQYFLP